MDVSSYLAEINNEKFHADFNRAHATKDIKPYVCISEDCMSDIQFFERRRDWIDHMHKFHTPHWIQYMHKPLRWKCSLCCSDSNTEFISEEEAKSSFKEHLEQSHPHTDTKELHHLVDNCAVPQFRSSEHCPICGTLHQPAIPLESDSGPRGTEDASHSQHKPKVRFAAPETPNGEDEECLVESPWRSTRATDGQGVENCIAEHLRALALNFSARLIDDAKQRDSDAPPSRSSDSDRFELESLPQEGLEDDSPRLPSCICDEIDRFPIPNEEKAEMRECIAKNLHDLSEESDEQINWNFNWIDGYRVREPNIPDEERERLFPDDGCPENGCDLLSRASKMEEFDYREITNATELPFTIFKNPKHLYEGLYRYEKALELFELESRKTERRFIIEMVASQPKRGEGLDETTKRVLLEKVKTLWHARHQHVIEVAMAFTFEGNDKDEGEGPYFGTVMEAAGQGNIIRHLACLKPAAEMDNIPNWFGCLANAIAYIHSIGISHRDIKPRNILLRDDGTVMLANFGISRMDLGKTLPAIMPKSSILYTPRYAAPEVGEGGFRGRQSDIFSLGAVFFEMLLAHSFKHLLPQLSEKLTSCNSHDVPGPAYAPFLREVHGWINEIQADLKCGEEHWHRTILSLCLRMTSEMREERPSAEEVYSILSGEAGLSCNCEVTIARDDSQRLIKACQRPDGYDEVISLLGKENNLRTKGAIQQAASHSRLGVVQQFLVRGADVNQLDHSSQTALHCAAAYGHADITKLLLEHGATIDIKDEEEQLPLHCASVQGQLKVVEMLLEHDITGATLLSEDYYGQIPLHCAAKRGFTDVVRFLIGKMKNNAVMETDARQRTALHLAAGYGSEAVVRLLLDTATDKGFVDSLDETGMTALHWATIGRRRNGSYIKVMEVLLERGADVNIKGGADDKTAINHARDNQDEERIAVLLRADKIAR